jgi:putative flippase GtrA
VGSRTKPNDGTPSRGDALLDELSQFAPIGRALRFSHDHREQLSFLVVGVWNTAFGFGEWALLQNLLHERLHYLVILVLAWPIAVLNAYLCYRRFVFRSSASVWRELPRFSIVYLVTLLAGLVALPFLLQTLPFDIYMIQAGYTVLVVILSYLAHRLFSFGGLRSAGGALRKGD